MPVSFQLIVTVKRLDQQNQGIRHMEKTATMIEEKIKGMSRLQKEVEEEVRSLYNEGYYTDNINTDSLHQESEYQAITDDDIYQKNLKKKQIEKTSGLIKS